MRSLRWLVPALVLVALAGLVAYSNILMSSGSQKASELTAVKSGCAPGSCGAKSKPIPCALGLRIEVRNARPNSPSCGCLADIKRARGIEKSPTFGVVRACCSAIQHSFLITVLGVADDPKPDEPPQVEKTQASPRQGKLVSE